MTSEGFQKFKSAMEAVGITYFGAAIDDGTNIYNSDSAVIVDVDDTLYNFRNRISPSDGFATDWIVTAAYIEDVHHVKCGCPKDKLDQFIDALGVTLTDKQKAVIKNNGYNRDINPITGDYVLAGFKVLSEEELAKLSDQQKIDYEKKLEIYNKRQKASSPIISVSVG
jgi:hypothetical protein